MPSCGYKRPAKAGALATAPTRKPIKSASGKDEDASATEWRVTKNELPQARYEAGNGKDEGNHGEDEEWLPSIAVQLHAVTMKPSRLR